MIFFKKFLFIFSLVIFLTSFEKVNAATYTWDGGGGDNNWSTAANWSSDIVPTSTDSILFDGTSVKDSTIDASFQGTFASTTITSAYSGTITTARNATTTGNFTISGGTFDAGGYDLGISATTQNGSYTQVGGTFTAPGSGKSFLIRGNMIVLGGTFNHNLGIVTFNNGGANVWNHNVNAAGVTFNLVTFNSSCAGGFSNTATISSGTTITLPDSPAASVCSLVINGTVNVSSATTTWAHTGGITVNSGGVINATTINTINILNNGAMSGLNINSGGTLNAPSLSAVSITGVGNFAVSSGATFPNGNSLALLTLTNSGSGSLVTITAPSTTFGNVVLNSASSGGSGGGVTISAGTTIPVSIAATTRAGTLTVNGVVNLTASTTWNHQGNIVINSGGVINATTITTINTSLGTSNGLSVNSGGTLNAPSLSAVSVTGVSSFVVSSGATFPNGNSLALLTLTSSGSGSLQTITAPSTTFGNVVLNNTCGGGTGGGVTISAGTTIPLGDSPTTQACTLTNNGTITVGSGTWTFQTGPYGASTLITNNGTITGPSSSLNMTTANTFTASTSSAITLASITTPGSLIFATSSTLGTTTNVTMTGADTTLTAPTATFGNVTINKTATTNKLTLGSNINLIGDWTNTRGILTSTSTTVTFSGTNQTISGSNTFQNLTKQATTSNQTLSFSGGATTTVAGILTLNGTSEFTLSLRSTTTGAYWGINPQGTRSLSYLDVKDSYNTNSTKIDASNPLIFTDSGHNSDWNFGGLFLSTIKDGGAGTTRLWNPITWNQTLPPNTTIVIAVRGGNTATPDGTWTSFTDIANNGSLSAYNSYRYIQYRAILTTTNIDNAASLQDVTISYASYTPEASLVSSPYNTTDDANILAGISWVESVPTGTTVKFQIRTSPDGTTWTTYRGPDNTNSTYFSNTASGCTKLSTTVTCTITGGQTISDGTNDRYVQYQVTLGSDSSVYSPSADDIHLTYVVNARPDFNVDYPSSSAGGSVASQDTDGSVSLGYSVRDADATTGTYSPGFVTPSFQYSIDGGSNWVNIASTSVAVGDAYPKAVGEVSYTTHSATWNAVADIPNIYTTSAQMRVVVSDSEPANNLATSTTASFTLDTKVPTYGSIPLHIDISSTPANIYLSCSDDSDIEMRIGKVSNLSDATWVTYNATSSLSVSNRETVYAQCRDQYENTSAIRSALAPTQLTGMFYQDVSNIAPPEYREFITWGLASEPSLGFSKYNIWRSSDGGSYTLLTTVTNRLVNYIIDNDLSTDINYSYKVTIEDLNGNISKYSSVVSDTPDGVGGTDISKPSISSVVASTTGPTTAVITFITDKLSNSLVSYVATTTYPDVNSNMYTLSQGVPSMVTSHSVTLSGLTPDSNYYFFVSATDPSSNTGTSYSSLYYLTTDQGPVISTVSVSKVFPTEATIVWNTNTLSDSSVVYSDSISFSNATTTGSTELVTSHGVPLSNLVSGQKYYYYVKSTDANNNQAINNNVVNGSTEYFTFTATVDNKEPQVSTVTTALTGETGAAITWTTDEDSNSTLYYGTTTSLGSTRSNNSNTTEHTIALGDLATSTTYYFKVRSTDRAGNVTTDDNSGAMYSFTTNTPGSVEVEVIRNIGGGSRTIDNRDLTNPNISDIKVINITKTSAVITFTTSKVANDKIEYGTSISYGKTINNEETYNKIHRVPLDNLKPDTSYHFQITAADIYKNTSFSADQVFKTLNSSTTSSVEVQKTSKAIDTSSEEFQLFKSLLKKFTKSNPASVAETLQSEVESPVITGTEISVDVGSTFATVKWNTDRLANSQVSYAKASDYDKNGKDYTITAGDPDSSSNNHRVLLDALEPGTTYHYQVRSQDLIGPAGVSEDKTFTTSSLSSDIANFKFTNVKETEASISWQTSIPTTPVVTITDNKTGKSQVLKDPSFLKDHSFDIKSLKPATSYTIKIESKDEKGSTLSTNTMPFSTVLTKNAPVVSNVRVSTSLIPGKEERVQTIITWTTDKPSTSQIFYSDSLSDDNNLKQSTVIDSSLVQDHIVITTVFKTGKVYKFQVESGDVLGKNTRSETYTVLTPYPKETVIDLIVNNFEDTFGFLKKK